MINTAFGFASNILYTDETITRLIVTIEGAGYDCINYNLLTGQVMEGDKLLVNTTAVDLSLGSGGYHFVIANLSTGSRQDLGKGHIMKLRYTPVQLNCLAAESQESVYHDVFNSLNSLYG